MDEITRRLAMQQPVLKDAEALIESRYLVNRWEPGLAPTLSSLGAKLGSRFNVFSHETLSSFPFFVFNPSCPSSFVFAEP